ncbi:hypothetical protein F6V30_14350 [Oryzomonas sagensis]|uniref:Uncharacterized protein n=1 Tax=Oryzomonas sagensis TaxID=2603857 RepID=A0ABQ6TLF2_9BACT|nr:hypothetical protein [Oryzomonas sagensis]KAB0669014.1 hypothetical protein F6V30_14350 [Oryzomonas sagensis]
MTKPSSKTSSTSDNGRVYYIITPLGDLEGSHWRGIRRLPDGPAVIVIGLRLRNMAAEVNQGGRLVHLTGEPMSLQDIARALDEPLELMQYSTSILAKYGLADGNDDLGWTITDPVVLKHVSRALPGKSTKLIASPPKLVLDRGAEEEKTEDRERREARNRKRLERYRSQWGCEPPEIIWSVTTAVTNRDKPVTGIVTSECHAPLQYTENTTKNGVTIDYRGIGVGIDAETAAGECHETAAASSPSAFLDTQPQNPVDERTPVSSIPVQVSVLPPEIETLISKLPLKHQSGAKGGAVAGLANGAPVAVVLDCLRRLSAKLQRGDSAVSTARGWLNSAITGAVAEDAEMAETKSQQHAATAERQLREAEAAERERQADLRRQAFLLASWESLGLADQQSIESEARAKMSLYNPDPSSSILKVTCLDILQQRYQLSAA